MGQFQRDDARPGGDTNAEESNSPVPPYEGRQESAEVDEGGTHRDGANVGGATGPRTGDGMTDPDPGDTPGGREWSPSDEMPATDGGDQRAEEDSGTGPSHVAGAGKAEDKAD